jgi:hypothetical protein
MHRIIARRLGRIAFGIVLLIGVSTLVHRALAHEGSGRQASTELACIIAGAWVGGAAFGWLVRLVAQAVLVRRAQAVPEALFAASLIVPIAGIALLLPITLHLPFAFAFGISGFQDWVYASIWITGATHVALAVMCALRAHRLAQGRPAMSPLRIYTIAVFISCVPFVVIVLPPIVVALTGLPFLLLLQAMETVANRERTEVAAIPQLPCAIAALPAIV